MGTEEEPFSPSDRIEVRSLTAARTRIAWVFTATATAATAVFLLRVFLRGLRVDGGEQTFVLMAVVLAITSGVVAWRLGWRPVLALRRDAELGQKLVVRGQIGAIDRQQNAYGETITHAVVDGLKVVGRGEGMAAVNPGDEVIVDVLPESGFVIGVRRADEG